MATTGFPPKKNTAFTFPAEVRSQADPTTFKSAPTIAAGDFKVSIDGAAYANCTNLPTASGANITFVLAAAEMNGDCIKVKGEDAAGAEWSGRVWTLFTATKQVDDLATQASVDVVDDFLDTEITDIRNRLPAALVGGRMDSSIGAVVAGAIAAASFAANALDAAWTSATRLLTGAVSSVTGSVGSVTGAVGSVTGAVGSVTGSVGSVAGNVAGSVGSVAGNVGGTINGLTAPAKADVKTQVTDALSVDTHAESAAVPAATSSIKDKIVYLFTEARNKTIQTATSKRVRNDADTADISTAPVTFDGTTFTKGKDV